MYGVQCPAKVTVWCKPVVCLVGRSSSELLSAHRNLGRNVQVILLVKSYQVTLPLDELFKQRVIGLQILKVLQTSNFIYPEFLDVIFFHFVSTKIASQGIFW